MLATEPRYVVAIDVDSRASVYVPLRVKMQQPAQVIIVGLSPVAPAVSWVEGHVSVSL